MADNSKPKFKTIDGRLHKLVKGKYVKQNDLGFWKLLGRTKRNLEAVGRREGESHPTKEGMFWDLKKGGWTTKTPATFNRRQLKTQESGSGLSEAAQQNLAAQANVNRARLKTFAGSGLTSSEIAALGPQQGEGSVAAGSRLMSTWREDPKENLRLQKQFQLGQRETYKKDALPGSAYKGSGIAESGYNRFTKKGLQAGYKEFKALTGKNPTSIQKQLMKGGWSPNELFQKMKASGSI